MIASYWNFRSALLLLLASGVSACSDRLIVASDKTTLLAAEGDAATEAAMENCTGGCTGVQPPFTHIQWSGRCVGLSLTETLPAGLSRPSVESALLGAFATWEGIDCPQGGHPSIQLSLLDPVRCDRPQYNRTAPNANAVLFSEPDEALRGVALTTVSFDLSTQEIYDTDIQVNKRFNLSVDTPPSGFDLESIFTEEVGRVLGIMGMVDPFPLSSSNLQSGQVIRQPSAGAIDVVCQLYPPGRAAACDATPRNGFGADCATP